MTSPPPGRGFLFLQGMATRFFERLGQALLARGHAVHRVNFNAGDRMFWRLSGAVDFRGREHEWPEFLDRLVIDNAISDIILFGDCRPLHRAAIRVAERRAMRVHVVEEGYIRPDWVTFEEGGVNGYSALPRDPDWYRERARGLPEWERPPSVPGRFRRRAYEDVLYNLSSMAGMWRFPHYKTHRPYHQLIEYAGWLRRLALMRRSERRAAEAIETLPDDPIFFFPLQLDCDYQMRVHSPFRAMHLAIDYVLASFARHAPQDSRLLVKLHPFDSGLVDWAGMVGHIAVEQMVAERVTVLDGGDLTKVLARSRAVITVNSTVGAQGLANGLPVIALGKAVYDIPGLTFQGELDDFWHLATPPDAELFDAFRRVLTARCLLPGSFFNEAGLRLAVEAAVERLEASYARPAHGPAAEPAGAAIGPATPIAAA
ncbi:MAG TPA: capsular biosynthesis protein [Stellaceae bacterium]|jgi:capsular polysaccharide export protein